MKVDLTLAEIDLLLARRTNHFSHVVNDTSLGNVWDALRSVKRLVDGCLPKEKPREVPKKTHRR